MGSEPPDRHGAFRILVTCRACGHPLPLNRLDRKATCSWCSSDLDVPEWFWPRIFNEFEKLYAHEDIPGPVTIEMDVEGSEFSVEMRVEDPAWPDGGEPAGSMPAPGWVKKTCPTADTIRLAGPAPDAGKGGAAAAAGEKATGPVLLQCPGCGAGLQATAESTRIFPCRYCGGEVYLPDPIWLRLHPVRRIEDLFVRFTGTSKWRAEIDRIAEDESREAERGARRRAARMEERKRLREEIDRHLRSALLLIALAAAMLAAFALASAWCWLSPAARAASHAREIVGALGLLAGGSIVIAGILGHRAGAMHGKSPPLAEPVLSHLFGPVGPFVMIVEGFMIARGGHVDDPEAKRDWRAIGAAWILWAIYYPLAIAASITILFG